MNINMEMHRNTHLSCCLELMETSDAEIWQLKFAMQDFLFLRRLRHLLSSYHFLSLVLALGMIHWKYMHYLYRICTETKKKIIFIEVHSNP